MKVRGGDAALAHPPIPPQGILLFVSMSDFEPHSRLVHATSVFEEGWLIVQAQYYKLEQVSERGYRLLPEKRYLVVNSLVRLKGLEFSRTQGGPQQRSLRGCATGPAASRAWVASRSSARTCTTLSLARARRRMRRPTPRLRPTCMGPTVSCLTLPRTSSMTTRREGATGVFLSRNGCLRGVEAKKNHCAARRGVFTVVRAL